MKNKEYTQLFAVVKNKIEHAQIKTVAVANSQMLWLYWQLGNIILTSQAAKGWGAKVIDFLSADLKKEFPHMKGFSARNLKYMRAFASSYNLEIIQQYNLVADKLRTENISQKLVSQYLLSEQSVFVQQAVAQIQNTDNQTNTIKKSCS